MYTSMCSSSTRFGDSRLTACISCTRSVISTQAIRSWDGVLEYL